MVRQAVGLEHGAEGSPRLMLNRARSRCLSDPLCCADEHRNEKFFVVDSPGR